MTVSMAVFLFLAPTQHTITRQKSVNLKKGPTCVAGCQQVTRGERLDGD